jgi:hypothetical protein
MSTLEPSSTSSTKDKLTAKLRRNKKDKDPGQSTPSLVSSSNDGDDTASPSRNLSVDDAIDKLKARARKSIDASRASGDGGNRFSRLIPEKMKSRRGSNVDSSQFSNRSLSDDGTQINGNLSATPSQVDLEGEMSGNSSLLTEDSDNES